MMVWLSLRGFRHFKNISFQGQYIHSNNKITKNEFIALIPAISTLSIHYPALDLTFPLKLNKNNYRNILQWWPDMTWGTFTLNAYLAYHLTTLNNSAKNKAKDGLCVYIENKLKYASVSSTMAEYVAHIQQQTEFYTALQPLTKQFNNDEKGIYYSYFSKISCLLYLYAFPLEYTDELGPPFIYRKYEQNVEQESEDVTIPTLIPVLDQASHQK